MENGKVGIIVRGGLTAFLMSGKTSGQLTKPGARKGGKRNKTKNDRLTHKDRRVLGRVTLDLIQYFLFKVRRHDLIQRLYSMHVHRVRSASQYRSLFPFERLIEWSQVESELYMLTNTKLTLLARTGATGYLV